jgi:hypothetical protein
MSRAIMQQALDALRHHRQQTTFQFQQTNDAIAALEKELAKPEMPTKIFGPNLEQILNAAGFYRREWVGLTDEDTANICMQSDINNWHDEQVIAATEAKLKEKNNA